MCGFAGASWTHPGQAIDAATLDSMTSVLTHRGPDQSGAWFDAWTALGIGNDLKVGAEVAVTDE